MTNRAPDVLVSRRQALTGALAVAGGALGPAAARAETPKPSLNALAQAKGMRFGSAIAAGASDARRMGGSIDNPPYADVVASECGLIVPENEMKMQALRPGPDTFDFHRADRLMAFAAQKGLAVRGHNLLWVPTKWLPAWLNQYDFGSRPASTAETLLVTHVKTVCGHFGERLGSWDVINEAIDPATGKIRETVLTRHLGDRVIDIAFHAAREALPKCQLVYNDYMEWERGNETHRAGVLKLLERLRHDGVPVDALGLQSHIGGDSELVGQAGAPDPKAWRRFLEQATGLGLDLLVTEFDINDRSLPADPAVRDARAAAYVREYLDLTLSFPQVQDVLAWGMVDRFSWLNDRTPRADGLPKRPCPYDADYRPKPLRDAIAAALAGAPPRTAPHPPHA
jgi:endo-1,4-beta-xylanase